MIAERKTAPHLKELERLIGKCMDTYERLTKTKELAAYLQSYIIIKGSWSTVVTPEGNCYFNPTGNPGMATAGSVDYHVEIGRAHV